MEATIKTEPDYNSESDVSNDDSLDAPAMCSIPKESVSIKSEPELELVDTYDGDDAMELPADAKNYTCGLCEESFADCILLKEHVVKHGDAHTLSKREQNILNGKWFPCSYCPRMYAWPSHLKYHMVTHTGEKRHICPMCNKAFTRSSHLNSHMLLHTGEKPHSCPECNKSFSRQSHLKSHMLLHTGEKRNVCPVCSKSFTQACSLKSHLLIHSGERPHTCEMCSKSFTQYSNLKAHLLTHSGIKQQQQRQKKVDDDAIPPPPTVVKEIIAIMSNRKRRNCTHCSKSFAKEKTLISHMIKVHNKESFEFNCPECMEPFTDGNLLELHAKAMHAIEIKVEASDSGVQMESEDSDAQSMDDILPMEPEVSINVESEDNGF